MSSLEPWGGVECTVNRIGDTFHDQVRRAGHHDRADDIARFAALGIRALRLPILWERAAPEGLSDADWRWSGSGPRATSLLDPGFPAAFAAFAGAAAERYPSVADFTVNEPLTTARFSALYGHWCPQAPRSEGGAAAVSALASERGQIMPSLEQGLLEHCAAAADGLWGGGEPVLRNRPGQS